MVDPIMVQIPKILLLLMAVMFVGVLLADAEEQPLSADPAAAEDSPPVLDPAISAVPAVNMEPPAAIGANAASPATVYVVPVQGQISKPNLFILRRSLKQAIQAGAEAVVLDMDTPGGRLDVTLEMMELLSRFDGKTFTFVNKDAISAGAYISMATQSIYFAPNGVMGAAAVVAGGGQEIDENMRAKINSYLFARMRSYSELYRYRSEVIRAMADLDYVLDIDGRVLKAAGELLSLTAAEAVELFGDPPAPLLAVGIADSVDALLADYYGDRPVEIISFETTWSEELAKYLVNISPILLGLGFLALFIEFKTPGFGIAGIAGLVLIGIVFASNHVAGLAGMEAVLFFILGLAFIVVEIFFLPGTLIFLILGLLLILGSVIWSLADIWPTSPSEQGPSPLNFTVEAESLWSATYQLFGGLAIAVVGLIVVWRFLPQTPLFAKIVHTEVLGPPDSVVAGGCQVQGTSALPDVGTTGVVTRDLHPLGEVEINGERYQASVAIGALSRGTRVQVTGYRNFSLLVDKV